MAINVYRLHVTYHPNTTQEFYTSESFESLTSGRERRDYLISRGHRAILQECIYRSEGMTTFRTIAS